MEKLGKTPEIVRLQNWLDRSSCNFTAVKVIKEELDNVGFTELNPSETWNLEQGGKYYMIKNGSAIFAFVKGNDDPAVAGFHIISAHSDSPCFKLKPNPEIIGDGGVVSLNVEKYGGGILYTWFDRPLSLAGRVMLRPNQDSEDPMQPVEKVFDLRRPVATIPHLAIHFNRGVNEGNPLSVQKDMKPVVGYFSDDTLQAFKKEGGVVKKLIANHLNVSAGDIMGSEICLYPVQNSSLCGVEDQYLMSGRIDDLSMAFAALEALLQTSAKDTSATRVMAIFDNEETGSGTRQGAASPTLRMLLQRVCGNDFEKFSRALSHSFMVSADDAHAWHPNYNEKYDPTNHPVIGGGPAIKINANCKYMTDARGAAVFRGLCEKAGVPVQYFVNHADVAGGSTLGNILTSQMDIDGVDIGAPIWGMHSACETAGVADHIYIVKAFKTFFKE